MTSVWIDGHRSKSGCSLTSGEHIGGVLYFPAFVPTSLWGEIELSGVYACPSQVPTKELIQVPTPNFLINNVFLIVMNYTSSWPFSPSAVCIGIECIHISCNHYHSLSTSSQIESPCPWTTPPHSPPPASGNHHSTFCVYESNYPGYLLLVESYSCHFFAGLFHLVWCPQVHPCCTLYQKVIHFLGWIKLLSRYKPHCLSIRPSMGTWIASPFLFWWIWATVNMNL